MACYVRVTNCTAMGFRNPQPAIDFSLVMAESCKTIEVVAEAMRPYQHLSSVSKCRNQINIPRFDFLKSHWFVEFFSFIVFLISFLQFPSSFTKSWRVGVSKKKKHVDRFGLVAKSLRVCVLIQVVIFGTSPFSRQTGTLSLTSRWLARKKQNRDACLDLLLWIVSL